MLPKIYLLRLIKEPNNEDNVKMIFERNNIFLSAR